MAPEDVARVAKSGVSLRAEIARLGLRYFVKKNSHHETIDQAREKFRSIEALIPYPPQGTCTQRVAIARALVSDPAIILADEPTAALDTVNGQSLMQILRDIAADARRSVLVVTHDTRLIPFASRILSIEDGRLVGEKKQVRRGIPTRRNGSGRRGTRG